MQVRGSLPVTAALPAPVLRRAEAEERHGAHQVRAARRGGKAAASDPKVAAVGGAASGATI